MFILPHALASGVGTDVLRQTFCHAPLACFIREMYTVLYNWKRKRGGRTISCSYDFLGFTSISAYRVIFQRNNALAFFLTRNDSCSKPASFGGTRQPGINPEPLTRVVLPYRHQVVSERGHVEQNSTYNPRSCLDWNHLVTHLAFCEHHPPSAQ